MTHRNDDVQELTIEQLQAVSGGARQLENGGYGPASAYRFAVNAPADIEWVLGGLPPRPPF